MEVSQRPTPATKSFTAVLLPPLIQIPLSINALRRPRQREIELSGNLVFALSRKARVGVVWLKLLARARCPIAQAAVLLAGGMAISGLP